MAVPGSRRYSLIWKHYIIKDDLLATCKACNKNYNYKKISNLARHWNQQHVKNCDEDTTDTSDDEGSDHSNENTDMKSLLAEAESKSTWQYFEVLDSDQFLAKCKICEKDISYESISDLREHVQQHSVTVSEDEDPQIVTEQLRFANDPKKRRFRSRLWRYMRPLDDTNAQCKICNRKLSYFAGSSNLKKHLKRSHPGLNIDDPKEDNQKLLISTNGQLYEIQTSDGEKDPIATNQVYIDSSVDNYNHLDTITAATSLRKNTNLIKPKIRNRDIFQKGYKSRRKSNSSEESVLPMKESNSNNTLDYFGTYIISMLRKLPEHVSDQLQCEIVKQIVAAKVACETQYAVSVSEKPITVTINNETATSMPQITFNSNGDMEITDNKSADLLQNRQS